MEIRIERIVLREIRMPLVHFFETSFGRTTKRRIVIVEAISSGGLRSSDPPSTCTVRVMEPMWYLCIWSRNCR